MVNEEVLIEKRPASMKEKAWFLYAMATTILWGVWGALIELPEKAGFPATLGYSAWAVTLIPVALIALKLVNWNLDTKARPATLAIAAGFMGCGGQLILFQVLRMGPAYIIFPIISLYPVLTIILSVVLLKEKATKRAWTGIALALLAILMLTYQPPGNSVVSGYLWLVLAMVVFFMWGLQAYIMKLISGSNKDSDIKAESVTFYLMISALALVPFAFLMTDFSGSINWGLNGAYSALGIQVLNSVGFLFFAYAIKYGKAIIVVPMMSLAPVVTIILSLIIYSVIPHPVIIAGMVTASVSLYLLAE